jgi:hypothetical protein
MTFDGLAGTLFANRKVGVRLDTDQFGVVDRIADLRPLEQLYWEQARFRSDSPLTPEDRLRGIPPFDYPIVWRRSGPRLLLLSKNREVVDHFRRLLAVEIGVRLEPVTIAVDAFVKQTAREPSEYVLSFVHARVSAFGTSLRSASFYGDDVGEAKFFRDGLDLFNCHTCGLRHVTGGAEIVRLGNDGAVSFKYTGPSRLLEVENTLAYLRKSGYLADSKMTEDGAF